MGTDLVKRHQDWMRDRGLAESYIGARGRKLERLSRSVGKPLPAITEHDLVQWRSRLRLAPDSVRGELAHVHQFYDWMLRERLIKRNPADRIAIPKASKRLPRPIAESMLRRALAAAVADIRLMMILAGACGLRACEIASLRWDAIDLEGGSMLVTGKGGKQRMMPLLPWIVSEIRRYGARGSGWVFPRRDGKAGANAPWTISARVNDYLHALGIRYTCHSLRHRFATIFLDSTQDIRQLQELMGHESLTTTSIYTKVNMKSATAAMAEMPVPV